MKLDMKRSASDRVHRPDCSYVPPFAYEWHWPDDVGLASYEAVAEKLRHQLAAGLDVVKPCAHCLPEPVAA